MRKIINYTGFYNQFAEQQVFSREQAEQVFPKFDSRRLFEWKQKNYLYKLTNKWYCFTQAPNNIGIKYLISNSLCSPSYISLESALFFHQLILDVPVNIHAITQHKTVVYYTPKGNYNYRKIKPSLFLGFESMYIDNIKTNIASKEKAFLDYLYFNAELNSLSKMSTVTWNIEGLNLINWKQVVEWQKSFQSKALNRRVDLLKKLLKIEVI
jgi:predicted transcriptional regulator of viral defense system